MYKRQVHHREQIARRHDHLLGVRAIFARHFGGRAASAAACRQAQHGRQRERDERDQSRPRRLDVYKRQLKKNGIRIRPRVDFRDPALRETLGLGIPALFVMLCSTIVVSVQTAAAYGFSDNGPSILLYARQWFTLPYSFLAVPITTAMFTELADMQAEGNAKGVKRGIVSGTNQILFFMIPFALYLMVFALPLVTLYHAGAFTMDNVNSIATYMTVLAFALPVYGVNTYLQKIFSSLRKMGVFAAFNFVAGAAQIALTMFGAANVERFPIEIIAAAEVLFYVAVSYTHLDVYKRQL